MTPGSTANPAPPSLYESLRAWARPAKATLPGRGLTIGVTWVYLACFVVVPVGALFLKASTLSGARIVAILTAPRVLASFKVTLLCAIEAAALSVILGTLVAWTLARYKFWGKALLDAAVDLPFALPTAVAGIALTFVYGEHGWIGQWFAAAGIPIAYTERGIVIALAFVGFPLVVRTIEPVFRELDPEMEEAAYSLGAGKLLVLRRVVVPEVLPAVIAGFSLALARAIGEYGSVIFIAGNLPMKTEIAPLLIVTRLEEFDYEGAAAIATALLLISLALIALVHIAERWSARKLGIH